MGHRWRALAFVLYLAAGLSTGCQATWTLGWSVWGRTPLLYELIALLGAVALLSAAGVTFIRPRAAAFLGIAASAAIWPFYIAYAGIPFMEEKIAPTNQQFEVIFVRWAPDTGPMIIDNPRFPSSVSLSAEELDRLRREGVNAGTLEISGRLRTQRRSAGRMLVVASHQLPTQQVDLPQPKEGNVIYLQRRDEWIKIPPDVPTSDRNLRLEIANHTDTQTWYYLEGTSGGTAYVWDER